MAIAVSVSWLWNEPKEWPTHAKIKKSIVGPAAFCFVCIHFDDKPAYAVSDSSSRECGAAFSWRTDKRLLRNNFRKQHLCILDFLPVPAIWAWNTFSPFFSVSNRYGVGKNLKPEKFAPVLPLSNESFTGDLCLICEKKSLTVPPENPIPMKAWEVHKEGMALDGGLSDPDISDTIQQNNPNY